MQPHTLNYATNDDFQQYKIIPITYTEKKDTKNTNNLQAKLDFLYWKKLIKYL